MPAVPKTPRPHIDICGLFRTLWETLKNLLRNLKELFMVPPHLWEALRKFFNQLPLILLILFLIVLMNTLPIVIIASFQSPNCLAGFVCLSDLTDLSISDYLCVESFILLSGWYSMQLILAGAPVGSLVRYENNETGEHVCVRHNAIFAMFISLSLIFVTQTIPFSSLEGVYTHYLSICVSSLFYAWIFALVLHMNCFKSEHLSSGAIPGLEIVNFFVGKARHPLIKGIDMKRFLSLRPGLIGLVFSDWLLLLHHIQTSSQLNGSFVLLCILHFCYILQAMNLEIDFLATFRYSREGFGYMHAWYSLVWFPLFTGLQSCYLAGLSTQSYFGANIPSTICGSMLFFIGFYIMFVSMKQKTIFRRMTNHPKVFYLSRCSIAPSNKNKEQRTVTCSFIFSGVWRLVRNPNILGELMMSLSFSVITGMGNLVVHSCLLFQIGLMVARVFQKEATYRKEYGNCHKFYTIRTPALIPRH